MNLAQIILALAALSATAAKMYDEGRAQTTAEEDAALANVWKRKETEDARFDAPAAGQDTVQG